MWEDAWSELEAIEPEVLSFPGVLLLRLRIFAGMGKWESAAALAAGMVDRGSHELSVFLAGAEAIRKTCGAADALHFLLGGSEIHFDEAAYRLACLLAQVGRLAEARERLEAAFKLDPDMRPVTLQDMDLDALW